MSASTSDRASLRRVLRARRRALSPRQQDEAAHRLFHRLVTWPAFIRAERIAFYIANDAELDPLMVLLRALFLDKECYLPVLSRHRPAHVSFAPFQYRDTLIPNRWGIPEPAHPVARLVSPLSLDLVFVPLVGFDQQRNRLGMGKGFYDRSFAFRNRCGWRRPVLVGLAYECQKVECVPVEPWDVKLDAVVTDAAVYKNSKGR